MQTSPAAYFDAVVAAGKKSSGYAFGDALATASIGGTVFNDGNEDGLKGATELGLGLWTVDLNYTTGIFAGKVVSATTNAGGSFTFSGLTRGSYIVKIIPLAGTSPTKPTTNTLSITLTSGKISKGSLFGEK